MWLPWHRVHNLVQQWRPIRGSDEFSAAGSELVKRLKGAEGLIIVQATFFRRTS